MSPFAGAEAEAKGGQALGDQPAGEAEERAGGPQEDTRAQAGGLINHSLVDDIFYGYVKKSQRMGCVIPRCKLHMWDRATYPSILF